MMYATRHDRTRCCWSPDAWWLRVRQGSCSPQTDCRKRSASNCSPSPTATTPTSSYPSVPTPITNGHSTSTHTTGDRFACGRQRPRRTQVTIRSSVLHLVTVVCSRTGTYDDDRLHAVSAGADDIEAMAGGDKARRADHPLERGIQRPLDTRRHHEIVDAAAGDTDQVVVMADEVLG